ncbi:MAG: HD domain-containing protein [Magnetococcales bacterium]|nr:HD domain-containing protein [Magnetococcales bacterium]NGZ28702.1 HD domain-containing protein [Magnetococcales bacterium]
MISLELGDSPLPWEYGDPLLLQLIDTPEMQRLRHISQLGLASRIYPSAEHSRFSHALGVMHLARRILEILMTRQPGLIGRELAVQIKVAALLHDVGHGPFSHVFQEIYPNAPHHEYWSQQIVLRGNGPAGLIRAFAASQGYDGEVWIREIIAFLGEAPLQGVRGVGKQIIASQLDADRMDYLLRDAHFTGVDYGRYDLEWLLHSLRVGMVAGNPRLCVDISKGPSALESYLTARNHMYRQVYDHKTVRAFESLLTLLFRTLTTYWHQQGRVPQATPQPLADFLAAAMTGGVPSVEHYLALDDTVILYALRSWANLPDSGDPLLRDLAWKSRLLQHRHPVYRRLKWHAFAGGEEVDDSIEDVNFFQDILAFFQQEQDTLLVIEDNVSLPVKLLVLVDCLDRTPYAHLHYRVTQGGEPVYVIQRGEKVTAAEEASSTIDFLGHARQRLARVFVDPRAMTAVQGLIREKFTSHYGQMG